MRKIKTVVIGVVLTSLCSTLLAQEDVSIMDLKEQAYLLMKDIEAMKIKERVFINKAQNAATVNGATISALQKEVAQLRRELKEHKKRDILNGYQVSSELKNIAKRR